MTPAPPPPATSRRRSGWPFFVVLALVLAGIGGAYFYFLGDEGPVTTTPPPPVAEKPEEPKAPELKLGDISGSVQVRRGKDGAWVDAKAGEPLNASDSVRTGEASYAVLIAGETYEVEMEACTEISVDELTASISRVLLGTGMATATVKGGKPGAPHTFEVKAAGSDAVARTKSGTFTVTNNASGTVAVGTKEGEVEFAGAGKVVIVRAGQQSIVRPGQGPSDPTAIPTSLLLKVRWPTTKELAKKKLVLAGTVLPGTHLEIAGKPVVVDASGKFNQTIQLNEGKNALKVKAHGVGGLSEESESDVDVDTTPPPMGVDKDLWK